MGLELSALDLASLEVAQKHVRSWLSDRDSVNVVRRWSDRHVATWRYMGLCEDEIEVLHLWAGLAPVAGVDAMSRQAKRCLSDWPLLDEWGEMPKLHLWRQVLLARSGYGCFPHLLYEMTRLAGLKDCEPLTRFAQVVLRLADWLWARLEGDPLTPAELYELLTGADQRHLRGRQSDRVTLYKVWQSGLTLAPFFPGFDLAPEEVLAALGDRVVEVNVWSARPEEADRSLASHECYACGLFSLDSYGWCWRSSSRDGRRVACVLCPRCQRRTEKQIFIGCPAYCGHLKDGACDLDVVSISVSTENAGSGHAHVAAKRHGPGLTREAESPTQGKLL